MLGFSQPSQKILSFCKRVLRFSVFAFLLLLDAYQAICGHLELRAPHLLLALEHAIFALIV